MKLLVIGRGLASLAAATVIAAACMPSSDAITDRPWSLSEINGAAPAVPGRIEFAADGTYTTQPGCNTGGGAYAIRANTISIEPGPMTAMACGEPADSQEQAFLAVLGAEPRFEIETGSGRLRLTDATGALVFVTP